MIIDEWWRRLSLLLRRDRATRELEEEMRLHRERRAEQLRASGLSGDEAEAAARRRFGNRTSYQEGSRDMWGLGWIDDAAQDLKYAARRLRQRPGFTFAVVGILALGTGATTAMFSAVDAAMLRPLPFAHPDELVSLPVVTVPFDPGPAERAAQGPNHHSGYGPSWAVTVDDIAAMHAQFSHVAVWAAGGLNLTDPDHPVRLNVGVVSADFFGTLGVAPIVGRAFLAEDGREGAPAVAVLGYGLWQRQFGGASMIGRMLALNGREYQVVGVMPPRFSFPQESDIWIPLSIPDGPEAFEPFHGYLPSNVIARLEPGVSVRGAAASLLARWEQAIGSQAANPRSYAARQLAELRRRGAALPLHQELVGNARLPLLFLLSATGLLLLIACANVTNLLLSQAFSRRREIAVREILGASRGRIVRQLLLESALLGIGGAIIGAALAPVAFGLIGGLFPETLAGIAGASINGQVLAATLLLGLLATATFGLWPALTTADIAPGEIVKLGTGPGGGTGRIGTGRRLLVGAEVALTVVLLIGAGLMLRSFSRVMGLDRGMITEHVGTLKIAFQSLNSSNTARLRVVDAILDQLHSTPGITAAGAVNDLPLGGGGGIAATIHIDGPDDPRRPDQPYARVLYATSGYFDAMDIRRITGRTFQVSDDSGAPDVAVISARMAKEDWPGRDPLGRTLFGWTGKTTTVIGVVSDVRELSLENDPMPQMYASMRQGTPSGVAIVARGTLSPAALLTAMRQAVHAADPSQAVYNVKMMDAVLNSAMAPRRTNTALISHFAALALALASLGVYAAASYGVTQRTREFGIRAALGATARDLAALVSSEMLWVTGTGLVVGLASAWMLARVADSLIYGVTVHDPATFAAVPLALLAPAAAATMLPARRAARANPVDVMRAE